MTDADGFRQAIIDAPDDDAPRLVYADWLDEREMYALANFIRAQVSVPTDRAGWYGPQGARVLLPVQCETTRIGISGCWWVTDNVDKDWFKAFAAEVIGKAKARNEWSWLWRRGFVDEMCLPADAAVLDLPELRKVYPIRRVTVVGGPGEQARQIVMQTYLPRRYQWQGFIKAKNKGVAFDFKNDTVWGTPRAEPVYRHLVLAGAFSSPLAGPPVNSAEFMASATRDASGRFVEVPE